MTESSPFKLKSHPERLLNAHLNGVCTIALGCFDKSRFDFPSFDRVNLRKALKIACLFHDFGKATPWFQEYIRDPEHSSSSAERKLRRHGLISALVSFGILTELLPADPVMQIMAFIIVRRHHGNLENYRELLTIHPEDLDLCRKQTGKVYYKEVSYITRSPSLSELVNPDFLYSILEKVEKGEFRRFRKFKNLDRDFTAEHYFVLNFLYSLLLTADKTDAIMQEEVVKDSPILESRHVHQFKSGFKVQPENPIFKIRNELFQSVEESVERLDGFERLFSINTPTGSGKTITALNAALQIRERFGHDHIVYCLPFTSVIDQNFAVFDEIRKTAGLPDDSGTLLKHHHLTDIRYTSMNDEYAAREYLPNEALHLIEGWESRIVVTTFVQYLYSLVSFRNASLRKFHRFSNAVIILDEVQSIPHKYWLLVREMLKHVTEWMDSRIILVTATMPLIFSEEKSEILELVKDKESMFRNLSRIDLDVTHLGKEDMDWGDFCSSILDLINDNPKKDILCVMNTIRSTRELYQILEAEEIPHRLEYLSSHVIPKHRLDRIRRIKSRRKGEPVIVVSTQLVEAGVDIDLDIVVRDFAPLDSIFQACGRCNREARGRRRGKVILHSIKDSNGWKPSRIYDHFLLDKTKKVISGKTIIPEAEFFNLAREYFSEVAELGSQYTSKSILELLSKLQYSDEGGYPFTKEFKLIDDDFSTSLFIELDECAGKAWDNYRYTLELENGFEKNASLKQARRKLAEYIINVPKRCLPEDSDTGIYHLRKDRVSEYYDELLGFDADSNLPPEMSTEFI